MPSDAVSCKPVASAGSRRSLQTTSIPEGHAGARKAAGRAPSSKRIRTGGPRPDVGSCTSRVPPSRSAAQPAGHRTSSSDAIKEASIASCPALDRRAAMPRARVGCGLPSGRGPGGFLTRLKTRARRRRRKARTSTRRSTRSRSKALAAPTSGPRGARGLYWPAVDDAWRTLIEQIHASGRRVVLAITGGGSGAIGELLRVPGGSRTLVEAIVPYETTALAAVPGRRAGPGVQRGDRRGHGLPGARAGAGARSGGDGHGGAGRDGEPGQRPAQEGRAPLPHRRRHRRRGRRDVHRPGQGSPGPRGRGGRRGAGDRRRAGPRLRGGHPEHRRACSTRPTGSSRDIGRRPTRWPRCWPARSSG